MSLPLALAIRQAMVSVAIRTVCLLGAGGKKRFVLVRVDCVFRMTTHAERIDLGT